MPTQLNETTVFRTGNVTLQVVDRDWAYASANREAIDQHWQRARAANPGYFNGVIHLITALDIKTTALKADFIATDFKSFLHWRDAGFPEDANVLDGFGSALLRSREGHVILGRQRPGNINAGLSYLPGGFIDARDVNSNGVIDIKASILRELLEETGVDQAGLETRAGYLITRSGRQLSIAAEFQSALLADQLMARIHDHLTTQSDPELACMVVVRREEDMRDLAMPPYARLLLERLFKGL